MKTKATRQIGIGLAAALLATGCMGEVGRPSLEDLHPGLNMLDSETGLTGAYVKGNRAVYFETRRGPQTVEAYRTLDPDAPPYEMDARILDQNGRTLYVRLGGDAFVEARWTADLKQDLRRPAMDPTERAASLQLAQEAMDALSHVTVEARLVPEHQALVRTAGVIPNHMPHPTVQTGSGEVAFAPQENVYELHRKTIYAWQGEHSATFLNVYGTLIENCNHGECADSMGTKCAGGGGAGAGYDEGSGDTGGVTGSCLTGYSLFSTDGHNCHDDSVLQMRGMIWGGQDQWGGICDNGTSHRYAPNCGTNNSW